MAPDRLAHLIFPGLSLAFVTSAPGRPWPNHPYRRLRLDCLADTAGAQVNRPKLRFTLKVADALEAEAISGLGLAKAAHDTLESLYNPHVDFEGVYETADRLSQEILSLPPVSD